MIPGSFSLTVMSDPFFFSPSGPVTLGEIAALTGIALDADADTARRFTGLQPLDRAGPADIAFLDNPKYAEQLDVTLAGACFVAPKFRTRVPVGTAALVTPHPYHAYAALAARFYPDAMRPQPMHQKSGISPAAHIHPEARLEQNVIVDPGAVIGPGAEIGSGTIIAANAVIGPGVRIGRDCSIGPNASLVHALLGNSVIVHGGVRIGQDGFGYAMGPKGHMKVPQTGRVIIQDKVEIGANSTIDRGASRDTVIGEGTKIDNLVQIAHNVVIGRHCVIVAQVGISGSTTLEDFVVLGGQVGVVGHLRIGAGSQIAGSSNVADNVPPGSRWGGTPAKPVRQWFRELTTLAALAKKKDGPSGIED